MRGVKSPKRALTIFITVALKNRTLIIPIGSLYPATKYRNAVNGSISQGKNLMYPRLTSFVINGPWYRSIVWLLLCFFDFFCFPEPESGWWDSFFFSKNFSILFPFKNLDKCISTIPQSGGCRQILATSKRLKFDFIS